jgi:hypothetical protein
MSQVISVRFQVESAKVGTIAFESSGPAVVHEREGRLLLEAEVIRENAKPQGRHFRLVQTTRSVVDLGGAA